MSTVIEFPQATTAPLGSRDEWLAARRTGIGGSDVHHLFSLKPYGCERRLMYDKTNTPPDYPQAVTSAMERGTRLEEIVAEQYALKTGRRLLRGGALSHPERPYMRVNIDREVIDPARGEADPGVLEIKVPGREAFYRVKRTAAEGGGLPDAYILQIQHGIYVRQVEWGAFAVFWADGWELLKWDVARDNEIIARIVEAADDFWARKQQIEASRSRAPELWPERLAPGDRRCESCPWRTTCQGQALLAGADSDDEPVEGEQVTADPMLAPLVAEYFDAKTMRDEAKALFDETAERLKKTLAKRTAVDAPGARIYFRPSQRTTTDSKMLAQAYVNVSQALDAMIGWAESAAAENPRLELPAELPGYKLRNQVSDFEKKSPTRTLRVYPR